MAGLLAERGVVPLLIDDRAGRGRRPGRLGHRHPGSVVPPDKVEWGSVDVVVRAPGVSRYRPELVAAEEAGVTVTTAMALWLEDYADARVVAITGTKGKSTTAALAAAILRERRTRGRAHRQHRRAGHRHLRPAAGRRLRRRGLLVSGGGRDRHPRRVRAHQPGPRPPRLARGRGALLPGQAPADRGGPAGRVGRQRGERRGAAAHRRAPRPDPVRPDGPGAGHGRSGAWSSIDERTVGTGTRPCGCRDGTTSGTCAGPSPGRCCSTGGPRRSDAIRAAVDGFDGLPSRCRTVGRA